MSLLVEEDLKIRAKLAGCEVKDSPRRKGSRDTFGEMMAEHQRMRDIGRRMNDADLKKYMKPL